MTPERRGGRPRQGRGGAPARAARSAAPRGRRRAARHRLRVDRRLGRARARGRRGGARDHRRGVRPRPHAQPRRGARRARSRSRSSPRTRRPCPGWLDALLAAFALGRRRRRRLRPPPPAAGHEPDDRARARRVLRDVRAAGAAPPRMLRPRRPDVPLQRERRVPARCWAEIRFDDVPYSEDQAFGRALAAHATWRKAYAPAAAVLHAHDYPPARVHAALLRRVSRAARDDRPRRADRRPHDRARRARARRPATGAGCAARFERRARLPLDRPLARPPHGPQGVLRARAAAAPSCRCPCSARCRWRAARTGPPRRAAARARRPAGPAPARDRRTSRRASAMHGYAPVARVLREGRRR